MQTGTANKCHNVEGSSLHDNAKVWFAHHAPGNFHALTKTNEHEPEMSSDGKVHPHHLFLVILRNDLVHHYLGLSPP